MRLAWSDRFAEGGEKRGGDVDTFAVTGGPLLFKLENDRPAKELNQRARSNNELRESVDQRALGQKHDRHLDRFKYRLQVFPEAIHRGNLHALVGAVRVDDRRAKRNHLHPGIFFADDAALEAGVHGD
jgi:hypothetical protein